MPTYHYESVSAAGQPARGSATAESLPQLASLLEAQGWKLARVLPEQGPWPLRYGIRVPNAELSAFLRQLAVMLRNQVPVPEAVGLMARECRNPTFQAVLHDVETTVRGGEPLSAALARYPRLFGPMQTATLAAGETSNTLDRVAERLAEYTDHAGEAVRRIRNAAFYPMVVCFVTTLLFAFTFVFIVPKYMVLMRDLGMKEFPPLTAALFALSQGGLPTLLLLTAPPVFLGLLTLGLQRGSSSGTLDRFRLRLPVIGRLFESLALFRVGSMLSIFLESRIPLLDALRLAGQGADNAVVQGALWQAVPPVAAGEPLGRALDGTGALSAAFCGQVSVAEENGDLPGTLQRLARWHGERIEAISTRMSAILEPILILGIGVCIAWIAVGLFWPLVMILRNLSGGES